MKWKTEKKHKLIWWLNVIIGILLCSFFVFLCIFGNLSIKNLMRQEIANRDAILKLNVNSVNSSLESIESYLYQFFDNSEDMVRLETGGTETEMFMAKQRIVNSLTKISGWNASLQFLFYYVPGNQEGTLLRVTAGRGMVVLDDALERQIKEYIDNCLAEGGNLGKGYLLMREGSEGYLVRFYKVRNSYIGMCLNGNTVLKPLEELTADGDCMAFICDLEGNVISSSEEFQDYIDLSQSGSFVDIDGEQYLQLSYLSAEKDFYIGTWTRSVSLTNQMKGIRRLLLALGCGFLLFMITFTVAVRKMLYRPIQEMETGMKKVGDGEWDYVVKSDSIVLEYSNMLHNFNEMVSEIKNLKIANYEKELDIQKSYLQYLQMQVNPHFYLNALNIIYSMAQVQNYQMIQEMAMSLVEYSRYMFRSPKSLVTVQQEMEHVENYMKIQKLRFPERIQFNADISSEVEDALIPPFIIQSFVENSIKYAINFEQNNICSIKGTLIESHEKLYVLIEVRDNGKGYQEEVLEILKNGKAMEDPEKHIGIRNVKHRLALVFGDEARLILKNEEGAVALVLIPLRWQEDEADESI